MNERARAAVDALIADFPDLIRRDDSDPLGFSRIHDDRIDGSRSERMLTMANDPRLRLRGLKAQLRAHDDAIASLTHRRDRLELLAVRIDRLIAEHGQ